MVFSPQQFELASWCEANASRHLSWDDVASMHQGTVRGFLRRGYFREAPDHSCVVWTKEGTKALDRFKRGEGCWRQNVVWKFTASLKGPTEKQTYKHNNLIQMKRRAG